MSSGPMTAHERDLKAEHFLNWLDEQARERQEREDVRARLADAQRRLDELERRLGDVEGQL